MDEQPTNDDNGTDQPVAGDQPDNGVSIPVNSDTTDAPIEPQTANDEYKDEGMADESETPPAIVEPEPETPESTEAENPAPAEEVPAEEPSTEVTSQENWTTPAESEAENNETAETAPEPSAETPPAPAEEAETPEMDDTTEEGSDPAAPDSVAATGVHIDSIQPPSEPLPESDPVPAAGLTAPASPPLAVQHKKRGLVISLAVALLMITAAAAYYFFFMASDMQRFNDDTLAISYPKDWNYLDQGDDGLAFYPGESFADADTILLVFENATAIESYDELSTTQKDTVKENMIDYYTSDEFSQGLDGGEGNLAFDNGREVTQKGADMALSFDADGVDNNDRASSGLLRVLISPTGDNVILLLLAIEDEWVAHQNLYAEVADSLELL